MAQPWRKLARHPLSAQYPDLTGKKWEEYRESVSLYGPLSCRPVVLHEGMVLDGWQLHRACVEIGKKPKYVKLADVHKGIEPDEFVRVMNDVRRHEADEIIERRAAERRDRAAKARGEGKSLRQIADDEDVSVVQVQRDLTKANSGGELKPGVPGGTPEPAKTTGKDGKSYPANAKNTSTKQLCDRCNRVGAAKDCPACKDLHKLAGKPAKVEPPDGAGDAGDAWEGEDHAGKEPSANGSGHAPQPVTGGGGGATVTAKRPPKSGAVVFDDRKIVDAIGKLVRLFNERANAHGQQKHPKFTEVRDAMNLLIPAWDRWRIEKK